MYLSSLVAFYLMSFGPRLLENVQIIAMKTTNGNNVIVFGRTGVEDV